MNRFKEKLFTFFHSFRVFKSGHFILSMFLLALFIYESENKDNNKTFDDSLYKSCISDTPYSDDHTLFFYYKRTEYCKELATMPLYDCEKNHE